jgi:hypothetical protein
MQSRETIRSETESVIFGGHWLAYRLFPLGDGIGVEFTISAIVAVRRRSAISSSRSWSD